MLRTFRLASLIVVTAGFVSPAAVRADDSPAGRKYALLVGVSDYKASAELRRLPGAANDVTKLREVLINGGFEPGDVTLMTNASAGKLKPTGPNIRDALSETLGRCKPEDTVILAFAGHGLQFSDQPEQFFCPYDAVWNDRSTLIPLLKVFGQLGECASRKKLLLVDACRNDPLAETDGRETNARSLAKKMKVVVPDGKDFAALFSCNEGQTSWEDRRLDHGVFFYHVILGLAGEAAAGDGTVTFDELNVYVRQRVKDYVKEHFDADQEPRLVGELGLVPLVQPNVKAVTEVQKLLRSAVRATELEGPKAAVKLYDEVLKLDPKNADAYYLRGVQKMKLAKSAAAKEDGEEKSRELYKDAARDFGRSLKYKPGYVEAYLAKADTDYELNSREAALQNYELALEDDPNNPKTLRARGFVYRVQKEYAKALRDLNDAIEAEPENPVGYYYRALIRIEQGKSDDAIPDLNKAIALDPQNTRFRDKKIELAIAKNDIATVEKEEARQEQVAAYVPKTDFKAQEQFISTRQNVGNYYQGAGRTEQAAKTFEKAARQAEDVVNVNSRRLDQADKNQNRLFGGFGQGSEARARQQSERADLEANRMPAFKQRAIENRMSQLEAARSEGRGFKAKALEDQIRGQLPPAMRKEFDRELKANREEGGGGKLFGGGKANPQPQPGRKFGGGDDDQPRGVLGGAKRQQQAQQDDQPRGLFGGGRNQQQSEPRQGGAFGGRQQQSQPSSGGGLFGGGGRGGQQQSDGGGRRGSR